MLNKIINLVVVIIATGVSLYVFWNNDHNFVKETNRPRRQRPSREEEEEEEETEQLSERANEYREKRIDLHGLFLKEAIQKVDDFLNYWGSSKSNQRHKLTIITGAGHHSRNNVPVIRPAVEAILRNRNLMFRSMHGDGGFVVTLPLRQ